MGGLSFDFVSSLFHIVHINLDIRRRCLQIHIYIRVVIMVVYIFNKYSSVPGRGIYVGGFYLSNLYNGVYGVNINVLADNITEVNSPVFVGNINFVAVNALKSTLLLLVTASKFSDIESSTYTLPFLVTRLMFLTLTDGRNISWDTLMLPIYCTLKSPCSLPG